MRGVLGSWSTVVCLLVLLGAWGSGCSDELPGAGMDDAGQVPDSGSDPCANVDCSSLNGACVMGVCDPGSGGCVARPNSDGSACDDGDVCTRGDVCVAGACGGSALDCTELDSTYFVGVCDPDRGECVAAPVDPGCVDGSPCTACGTAGCEGASVLVGFTEATELVGNVFGGEQVDDDCPVGQVPIGLSARVSVGYWAGGLFEYATNCGQLELSVGDRGPSVKVLPGARLPSTGGWGTNQAGALSKTVTCPADTVLAGFSGTATGTNWTLSRIGIRCAGLKVTGSEGSYKVTLGAAVEGGTLGTNPESSSGYLECPCGGIPRGVSVRSGSALDALGLRCGVPKLIDVTTTTARGLASAPIVDECPEGQLVVGIEAAVTSGSRDYVLARYRTVCGTIGLSSRDPDLHEVTVAPGALVPEEPAVRGDWTAHGSIDTRLCPQGEVAVGFSGRTGTEDRVTALALRCTPLTAAGKVDACVDTAAGAITTTEAIGEIGNPFDATDCPPGTFARGVSLSAGEVLDAFALRCAPLKLRP